MTSIKKVYESTGVHIQETDWTCGPATLVNALIAKGETGHEEARVAEICGANPETGTDNERMAAGAHRLGLSVLDVAHDATLEQLEAWIDAGAHVVVCYISLSGAGHYALLTEYDEQALYFVDCTYGLLRIERDVFLERWRNLHEPVRRWYMAIE